MTSTITVKTDTAPGTPASGYVRLYAKSDGKFYFKDDTGTEYTLQGATGAAGAGKCFSGSLTATVASNALTIAVKVPDGSADPSGGTPVTFKFRSSTAATGSLTSIDATAALSIVVSSGSTLGTVNAVSCRFWVVAFNDAGTLRLGVINCLDSAAGAGTGRDVKTIFPLKGWGIASSTAEGGAGAADSSLTFYTGTAVTSKPYCVLGYVTYESGVTTAGTYAAAPTRTEVFMENDPLPGDIIQMARTDTGAVATGTTTIPWDDTIPQNTEGDQYMSQAITPTSAANVLKITAQASLASNTASSLSMTLFQDSVANAIKGITNNLGVVNAALVLFLGASFLASTTSSTTFKVRGGLNAANTTTFNGSGGGRTLGGVTNSFLEILEVMG